MDTNKLLERSKKSGPFIITRRGKPVAMLRPMTGADFSVKADDVWETIRESDEKYGHGIDDIEKVIKETRGKKRVESRGL
ncbi:MAG: hypothetical protein LLG37_07965 [Spirochaetia bacterium]|nr:hypothetical protein [Spirochaetia bacterium]